MSAIIITIYLIVCRILFGRLKSVSDSHYEFYKKWGFWGYPIFPTVMMLWATLVIYEAPELIWSGIGIYFVAIYAMFKCQRLIGFMHFAGAIFAILYLLFVIGNIWVFIGFTTISFLLTETKRPIYWIEILTIITLYSYLILK